MHVSSCQISAAKASYSAGGSLSITSDETSGLPISDTQSNFRILNSCAVLHMYVTNADAESLSKICT